jgi:hypothetical protein
MQTAVVGTQGILSYRLNLDDFPANARAYAYFAEIEDLGANETRKFKLQQPYFPDYSNAVVNIAENANGSHTLYEPSYMNVTLDFVLSFSFVKTRDSTQGPLLNAIEISKYLKIEPRTDSQDGKYKSQHIGVYLILKSKNHLYAELQIIMLFLIFPNIMRKNMLGQY